MTLSALEPRLLTSWERRLYALAHTDGEQDPPRTETEADADTLQRAYAACDALTERHSKTFFLASALMPADKRRSVRALYAFCRISDDLVDHADPNASPAERLAELEAWRSRALVEPHGGNVLSPGENAWSPGDSVASPNHLPVLAWADTMARCRIPVRYAHQLIDGVAKDVLKTRYANFEELAEYSYGVASTVGLMSMHITGFDAPAEAGAPSAIPYAVKLGVALQMTNILRDVGEDWRAGRVYLPQDELAAHGLDEAALGAMSAGRAPIDDRWRALMRFQIARNRRLYAESLPGVDMLHRAGRFAIAAAAELYRGILEDIEAHDYRVFDRRSHVGSWGKLRRLPGIWWRARWGYGKDQA